MIRANDITPAARAPRFSRPLGNLDEELLASNAIFEPLPTIWGRHRLGGNFLTPIFGGHAEVIREETQTGKDQTEERIVAYEYYGTFGMSLHQGETSRVLGLEVQNNPIEGEDDTTLFGEAVDRPANTVVPTTFSTRIGRLQFFWGMDDQGPSTHLDHLGAQPSRKGKTFFVADDVFFGRSEAPPQFVWLLSRIVPRLLLSLHAIEDEAIRAEVVYDFLVDERYGLALPEDRINQDTFVEIAEEDIANDESCSPKKKGDETVDAFLKRMQTEGDFYFYEDGENRIALGRVRPTTFAIPLQLSDFVEGPSRKAATWEDVAAETFLNYRDWRSGEDNPEPSYYADPGAMANTQGNQPAEVTMDSVTRESVANRAVQRVGRVRALPEVTYEGTLKATWSHLRHGHVVTFPHRGKMRRAVIQDVDVSEPAKREVGVKMVADRSYLKLQTLALSTTAPNVTLPDPENAFFRICTVPPSLRSPAQDGVLVAAARPHTAIDGGLIDMTWNTSAEWQSIGAIGVYAESVTINAWRAISSRYFSIDLTFNEDFEAAAFQQVVATGRHSGLYLLTCYRQVDEATSEDTHTIYPVFSSIRAGSQPTPHPVAPRRWLIDIDAGQLGTNPYTYAEDAGNASGQFPTSIGFIGSRAAFRTLVFNHLFFQRPGLNDSDDTDLRRYVRVRTRVRGTLEAAGEAAVASYDLDDTTMSAGGTLSPDWGAIPAYDPALGNGVEGEDEFYYPEIPLAIQFYRDESAPISVPPYSLLPPYFDPETGLWQNYNYVV